MRILPPSWKREREPTKTANPSERAEKLLGRDSVERTIEIDATPDEVYRVATDFAEYPVSFDSQPEHVLKTYDWRPLKYLLLRLFRFSLDSIPGPFL